MISFNVLKDGFLLNEQDGRKEWVKKAIGLEGKTTGDIQFVFCGDDFLTEINKEYLHHDTFTDIITFSNSANPSVISGDIFISIDRVNENAKSLNCDFENELSRVIIHGILHLLGYNDNNPGEKLQMRAKEDYYLLLQT
ncbi:MAG: rRNA maturation RNase YbeY [Bacteroidales bacterium]|nr:rRNA maturation RNase YbeY [Bacteroidales bacterium]